MLDNNVNQKQQNIQQFQSLTPQQQEQLRQQIAMQAGNPELLKENIQDSYVANRVSNTTNDMKGMAWTASLAVPTWYAIAKGMDKYAEKCRGNYKDTVLYKIGNAGDRFTDWIRNSSFGQSSFAQGLNNKFNSFKNFFNKNIIEKSRVTRAFAHTPSRPDLPMVKTQMDGLIGFIGDQEYKQHVEGFLSQCKTPEGLAQYGADAADISKWKSELAKATTKEAKELVMQKAEFECVAKYSKNGKLPNLSVELNRFAVLTPEQRIAKLNNMKSVELGMIDHAELKKILEHPEKYYPRIYEACHNTNPKMYYMAYEPGTLKDKVIGRKVYFSETANKMASSLGEKAKTPEWQAVLKRTGMDKNLPKSWLGRTMTKFNNIILEGATNRVAGGKLIAIVQAWFLAEAIYKSAKAEGVGDKARTFAERLTELVAMFACIPPALMLMHRIGGLQYAGMTPEQVAKYRDALKLHNEKAMSGLFKNKVEWKASSDNLKKMRKAGVKNPFVNLCKRIGRIVTVGLEQIRPYDKKDIGVIKDGNKVFRKGIIAKLKDLWHHPKFGMKQMAGYPMRIGLGMMVIMPFFSKLAIKGCHKIFGKPKNSVLDEGNEPEPQKQQPIQNQTQLPPQLQNPQQNPQQNQRLNQPISQTPQNTPASQTNLLNKYKNQQTNQTTVNNTINNTVNNNSPQVNKPAEPVRTYIPSPIGVQLSKGEDMTSAEQAMQRAAIAEQQALQALKMN